MHKDVFQREGRGQEEKAAVTAAPEHIKKLKFVCQEDNMRITRYVKGYAG